MPHFVRATRAIPSLTFNEPTTTFRADTIRQLIERGDYRYVEHESAVSASSPLPNLPEESLLMPGVPSGILQEPGGGINRNPQTGLMIPGGLPSTVNWPALVREGIDIFFGGGGGNTLQQPGPLVLPQQSPTPGLFPPGGLQGPVGLGGRGRVPMITMPNGFAGCPTGYHPMKDGQPWCTRNRRMNPLNPRALSRAGRRVGGFARAVKRARSLKRVCASL